MFFTSYSKSSHVFSGFSLFPHPLLFFSFADSILYLPSISHSLSLWGVSMLPPGVFKVLLQIVDQLEWLHEGGRGCVCVWWMIVWLCLEIDESHFSLDRGAGPQWQHTDMHTHYKPKQTFFVCSITILNWTKDTWNLITAVFVVVL